MSLRNHWNPFNLRSTPFFQDTLRSGSDARYPIRLFVGRDKESAHLLAELGSAPDSRQVVVGAPGHGKTTLVQYVKHRADRAGWYSYPDPVSLKSLESADELLLRILSYAYDTFYSNGGHALRASAAMETAQQLILAFRVHRGGINASVLGNGGGLQWDTIFQQSPFVAPFMIVPKLLQELVTAARTHEPKFRGILVHLNNLENLAEGEGDRGGAIVRDLRDVFLFDGFHYILVGTPEAVHDVVAPYAQVRSVFMVHEPLAPLSFRAFLALLTQRYEYLKLDRSKPVHTPVEVAAIREMYTLFGGDLRGVLKALNFAANQLIGYVGARGSAALTAEQIRAVLTPHYWAEVVATVGTTSAEYLKQLAALPMEAFTQGDLADVWHVSQPMISKTLDELQRFGHVQELGREGRRTSYALTGAARIATGRMEERA